MTTSSVDDPAHQGLLERYECMDCGHVGPAADLRSHVAQDGWRNLRTSTSAPPQDDASLVVVKYTP